MTEKLVHTVDLPYRKVIKHKRFEFYSGYASKANAERAAKKLVLAKDWEIIKTLDGYALYVKE